MKFTTLHLKEHEVEVIRHLAKITGQTEMQFVTGAVLHYSSALSEELRRQLAEKQKELQPEIAAGEKDAPLKGAEEPEVFGSKQEQDNGNS